MISRRDVLAATAAGAVATTAARAAEFGNPDAPPQGAINASPGSLTDPGPHNPALAGQFPSAVSPPATDLGDMPLFWASFNNAPKRIQNGGWARQVTQADFPIAETIAGVDMRLSAGGIRELHWHLAAEWAYMSYGHCRSPCSTRRAAPTSPTSSRAISGIFRPAIRTPCRGSGQTAASSSSASTMVLPANTTPCC